MARMAKLDRKNIADIYTLTPLQQGMLFHYLQEPGSDLYFEQLSLKLAGDIDFKTFAVAWNFVIKNNEALRTVFRWEEGKEPVQVTLRNYPFKPAYYDLTGENRQVEALKAQDRAEKFDLQGVPFRVLLAKTAECQYEMIISSHHILYDGWSSGIILKEFFSAYFELLNGGKPQELIKNKFKEFVKWVRSRDTGEQKKFWQDYLNGFDSPVEFSLRQRREKVSLDIDIREYSRTWNTGFKEAMEHFVSDHRITLATLLYSARAVLSRKYNYCDDVIFGITSAGRSAQIDGIENMVGLFINTLPLRISFAPGETIICFLNRVHEQFQNRELYEHTSLAEIKEYALPGRQEELFNSIMVLENYPLTHTLIDEKILAVNSYSLFSRPHYDLTIGIEIFTQIKTSFYYNNEILDHHSIEKLAGHFENIINFIINHPEQKVDEIDMLTDWEKQQFMLDYCHDYPPGPSSPSAKTIIELFTAQVEKSPDHIAVLGRGHIRALPVIPAKQANLDEKMDITYRHLHEQSDGLAGLLIEKGVLPDNIIGIMMERSLEMITSIFGILKAGGAYLPIDPEYPQERIDYMLKDSAAKLLVLANGLEGKKVRRWEGEKVLLETIIQPSNHLSYHHSAFAIPLVPRIQHSKLAYVIYTSGSTGKPKGVLIEHSGLANTIAWRKQEYKLDTNDHVLQLFSFSFDGSVTGFFTPVVSGSRVVLLTGMETKDIPAIKKVIIREKITHFISAPSLYLSLLDLFSTGETCYLRIVTLAGEPLTPALVEKSKRWNPQVEIANEYGATENTVAATVCRDIKQDDIITIGKPINNTYIYIRDINNCPAPAGVGGELCIAGKGIARGYLNNPELTAERFKKHRSYKSNMTYISFYKTGDLARWLADGSIEFLGRIDNQVKIRGFRIEPGEIENRLLKHPAVQEAVVIVRKEAGGDRQLAAYFVLASSHPEMPEKKSAVNTLREYLTQELPSYMIPAYLIEMERLPLNTSGKVAAKLLPGPKETLLNDSDFTAPQSPLEKKCAAIWSELLDIDINHISINANFFSIGGHSLKLTRLASRLHRELNIDIPLSQLFKFSTIREICQYALGVDAGEGVGVDTHAGAAWAESRSISIVPTPPREYYDLSYAQRRLWIICQFEEDSIAYNEVGGLSIKGNFNPAAFQQALQALVDRHEILRTIFIPINGETKQKVLEKLSVKLEQEDLRNLKGPAQTSKTQEIIRTTANKAFNMEKAPLFVFKLLHTADEEYFLLVIIHHIINDGWSVGVIRNELYTLYNFFNRPVLKHKENNEMPLSALKFQYKDYTLWHNRLIAEGYFDKFAAYWLEKLKDNPNGIELPLDHPRQPVQTFNGGRVYYTVKAHETLRLKQLGAAEKTTLFMKLLALLDILLYHYTGEQDILVGAPIAARRQPELHGIIGFLVNTLVYRSQVNPEKCFPEFLADVQTETVACYENQDYPFDILVEKLELTRDLSRSPIFNVMLAVNNTDQEDHHVQMTGVTVTLHRQLEGFNPSVFDLVFFFDEAGEELQGEIMYNSDLFARKTIERMSANFLYLLENTLENPHKPVYDLEYITKHEYEQIIHWFNDNREEFPALTIQELVENQVPMSADKIAVVSPDGKTLSYDELNKRSNRLAHYLQEKYGARPGDMFGICLDRCLEMIIAILGVVKAGAGYVAIDPNYPKDRVQHMIEDSRTRVVLIDKERPQLFAAGKNQQQFVDIFNDWPHMDCCSDQNPKVANKITDIVYVIYTSGSTGMPNGAMLSHAILANLIQWQKAKTCIDGSGHCLQFTSINFCVSFQEIFTTFSSGGQVHLIGDIERQDVEYLMQFLLRHCIENLYLPFSYLNFLFNLFNDSATGFNTTSFGSSLKNIITAGEQLKITTGLKKFLEENPWVKLHNHYGSSEMHVVTSYTLDASAAAKMPTPPAGKPIANTRIYILDEYNNPVPTGVWGELCIDGCSEVAGYIHNPILTDKKLLHHPLFSSFTGNRLYRSGDLGRRLEDGNIELKGRKDFQVKIRGFRVEPSEIESKILALEKVKDCVVVVKETAAGEKVLAAYVVGTGLTESAIKNHLRNHLPHYMIPKFMILESLPLMPNGKVDREKLPEFSTETSKPAPLRPAPVVTAPRGQIKDFDSLPIPDRSLVNYDKYGSNIGLAMVRHTVALQASRGCPYNCLYCHKIWPKKHVFRSAENIFGEVALYYNMGVRRFVLVDDIFNLDVRNSSRFFEMVIKKGLNVHFFFPNGLRSDILTKDYIDLMAQGGTRGIGMALESASPRIQRLLKKNLDLDKLHENAEYLCQKHPEIILELFLMHGFPTETEEEAVMTLEFLKALHWIDFPYLHILKIFPHTDMAAMAMENGVSEEAIARSAGLAFHELPEETLPFAKSFTLKCQADFLGDYFLLKERLLNRLPYQMKVLTPEELVEKYNSYLPVEIKSVEAVLEFAGIEAGLLGKPDQNEIMTEDKVRAIDLDDKIHAHFDHREPGDNANANAHADEGLRIDALRVLLLDLSQFFSSGKKILYDGVEPPLGLMYLLTYLQQQLGPKVNGKIAKARIDFDSFEELKQMLEKFGPQVIGIRTLTYYNRFFHEVIAKIREWGFSGPIVAGGPYATSDYTTILKDPHVDAVVLSEGELTFAELITRIIENQGQLPGDKVLQEIAGLAYVPGNRAITAGQYKGVFNPDEWSAGGEGSEGVPADVRAAVKKEVRFENEIEEKLAGIWSELLGVEKGMIGREDNFFELGGHSLKATTMMTRIHKEFNVRVKLIDIFKAPNIMEVAALIGRVAQDRLALFRGIEPVEKKQYYVVSSAQKRMYILQQMEADNTAYNMPRLMELEGDFDIERLEKAAKKLIQRHEAFRTSFAIKNDQPVQIIHDEVEFEIDKSFAELFQKRPVRLRLPEAQLREFIRPFDLPKAPLLRVGLVKLAEKRYLLMVDMHHIIADGVSIDIMVTDFMALYAGHGQGLTPVTPVKLQYKDYAAWQQSEKIKNEFRSQENFWLGALAGEMPALILPTDFVRPAVQSFQGSSFEFQLDKEKTASLQRLAQAEGVTLFMLLLAIYNIFLAKVCGQEEVIVGVPIAGRKHADLERIIGMFVNTLALRNYPVQQKTFPQFLREIKQNTLEVFENQDYPFEELVEKLPLVRNPDRNPVFDTLFALQNVGAGELSIPGLKLKQYKTKTIFSKFDLSFMAVEQAGCIHSTVEFCTGLFKQETIEHLTHIFQEITSSLIDNPQQELKNIEIITDEEKKQVLDIFNDTAVSYPSDKTIHQLFEDQVSLLPDGTAALYEDKMITYQELNNRAGRLAGYLTAKGAGLETIVGIMLPRSLEMLTGLIGILKAGAAYLPIDPDYPQERIAYILKDSGAKLLAVANGLEGEKVRRWEGERGLHHSKQLAYIIYTSGSTGKPKGVMVEHRSVARLVKNTNYLEFQAGKRILPTGSLEFDASTFEIWGSLLNGLLLCLAPKDLILNPHELKKIINKYNISVMWMTAPLFNQMSDTDIDIFSGLESLLVGGDALSPVHINRLREKWPHLRVINGYGPTENTTFSTTFEIAGDYQVNIPIGKPIANSTAFIVDNFANLQPVGVAGELWFGGDGVARGYLNNPELTSKRFCLRQPGALFEKTAPGPRKNFLLDQLPFTTHHSPLYKTGDLARWLSDGNIEFLGRIDNQVKIRGFRIECGEIENFLRRHPDVKEAIVTAHESQSGDKYLCAYLVMHTPVDFDFKKYLARFLPDYMIPTYFIPLEKIPLTPNGKVDYKALPKHEMKSPDTYSAPRDEFEQKLVTIWAHILETEPRAVGIDDNFFQLGGHSLKAVILISRLQEEWGVKLMLSEIFRLPTIRELAGFIHTASAASGSASAEIGPRIFPIEKKEYYPLSSNQERLWFIHQMEPQSPAYNMPGILEFPYEVNEKNIRHVLDALVKRHESFRTAFKLVNGIPCQYIHEHIVIPLRTIDISHFEPGRQGQEKEAFIAQELGSPFDLSQAPFFRAVLCKLQPNHYELIFNMHHIISDGWSMEILKREFYILHEAYRQDKQDKSSELVRLEIQYKDFAAWHNCYIEDSTVKNRSHRYWLKILGNCLPVLELPRDVQGNHGNGNINDKSSAGYRFIIDNEIKDPLKKIAETHRTSLFMVVFSAFNMLLARLTGQADIVCGIPAAGREYPGLQHIVGFFVNTVILRNPVDYEEIYTAYLERVSRDSLEALANQYYPLEKVLNDLKMTYPDIPVFFNMFNMDVETSPKRGQAKFTPLGKVQDVKFELVIYASEHGGGIDFECHYRENLFTPQRIEYMMKQYVGILETLADAPEKKVRYYLFKKERKKLIKLGGLP